MEWCRRAMVIAAPDSVVGRYVNEVFEDGTDPATIYGPEKLSDLSPSSAPGTLRTCSERTTTSVHRKRDPRRRGGVAHVRRPRGTGAPGRIRTADAGLRTASLYPLSYGGAAAIVVGRVEGPGPSGAGCLRAIQPERLRSGRRRLMSTPGSRPCIP